MWAGEQSHRASATKNEGQRLSIGFADDDIAYELRLGIPPRNPRSFGEPEATAFWLDPDVKAETIRTLGKPKVNLLERRNQAAMLRDQNGHAVTFDGQNCLSESVMSQLAEPHRYPVLSMLRERARTFALGVRVRSGGNARRVRNRPPIGRHW
jgi:hypothetical protein